MTCTSDSQFSRYPPLLTTVGGFPLKRAVVTCRSAIAKEIPATALSSSRPAHTFINKRHSISTNASRLTMTKAQGTNGHHHTGSDVGKQVEAAAQIINSTQIVCFDVDSTVITEEGIDELARYCGKGEEVARLTKEAMQGSMTFQDALKRRLDIINPSQQQIREFIKTKPATLSLGIKDFIEYLRNKGIEIYLVSGGFDCLIEPVARELGIPLRNVFANKLLFSFQGDYASFDTTQPTSRSGGKADALNIIKSRYNNPNVKVIMIGDGATDLEACPPATHFIGYGGNIVRQEVRNRSTYYVTDFQELMGHID